MSMYIPRYFQEQDEAQLFALMKQYSFATLVTSKRGVPVASHLPVLARREASGGLVLAPQVEDVVQVDVRQQRRHRRTLR